MKKLSYLIIGTLLFVGCKNEKKTYENDFASAFENSSKNESPLNTEFMVTPISHATMVLQWDETVIYIDPVDGAVAFEGQSRPDLILVTDIHGDHLNTETIDAVTDPKTKIIVPQAVADKLPESLEKQINILNNGEIVEILGFTVEAIPMYNLRTEALKFHEKGRGNGYVIEKNGMRIYISGDTEDISEMRNLKEIDIAFICMNLPYTMTVESAADAVLEFKPKTVYPYHYRGSDGLSDVNKFKSIVEAGDTDIIVTQLDWYRKK